MNEYENFALGNFLSYWNEDATYIEILDALTHEGCEESECKLCLLDDDTGVWEPFEHHDKEWVAEQIDNMKESVERRFIPKEQPLL
jgi:hypothetical protein